MHCIRIKKMIHIILYLRKEDAQRKIQKSSESLMEYSVFDSSKEERVAFIREHYSVVIGSNAINVVKKYM